MRYEFSFRNRTLDRDWHYVVEGQGRYGLVRIDKGEQRSPAEKSLPPAAMSLFKELWRGDNVKAPGHKIHQLRDLLDDVKLQLIEQDRNGGYSLRATEKKTGHQAVLRDDVELDIVRGAFPMSFLGRDVDSLILDEVIALRHDGKFFVHGFTNEKDPHSLAFLGGGEHTLIHEFIDAPDLDIADIIITESPYGDGYVLRGKHHEPLLFLGASQVSVEFSWNDSSPSTRLTRTSDWGFSDDRHEWRFDGAVTLERRPLHESRKATTAQLNRFESKLLNTFLRCPGTFLADDLIHTLWGPECKPTRGKRNALQKHLATLAGKLEPGRKLNDSTLIRNDAKRFLLIQLPATTYSFGGHILKMNDDRTRPITLPLLIPRTHHELRASLGSLDFDAIIAAKADGENTVVGFVPSSHINVDVLRFFLSDERFLRWLGADTETVTGYPEAEGVGRLAILDSSKNPFAYVGPSGRRLKVQWLRRQIDHVITDHRIPALVIPESTGIESFQREVNGDDPPEDALAEAILRGMADLGFPTKERGGLT